MIGQSSDLPARIWLILASCAAIVAGCAVRRESGAAFNCAPVSTGERAPASASELAGRYELTMVATSGPLGERRAVGVLSLAAPEQALAERAAANSVPVVLAGTAQLPVDSLGAANTGDLASTDPMKPGVVVLDQPGTSPRFLIRLGSESNRQDQQPFEAAYLVLEVAAADRSGFYGSWRSGVTATTAQGYFCARRL
ncbi:MAG: hypothetical protein KatS3mg081_2798 [Gemmatimonadales bacterium]|nr:MAG: hypothetical protein KatS3mg081_2798 [Gemmatimonadales bacterium]